MKRVLAFSFLLLLSGCGGDAVYTPSQVLLPSHIKNIAVRPFVNKTQQFGLEDKLTLELVDEFLNDGRYNVTNEAQADGILIGEITRYILTPTDYDANLVATQNKLQILVNIKFLDKSNNTILWEESNLEDSTQYFVKSGTQVGGLLEEEAREIIWENLARDIVKRTLEGFGTVMGTSERRITNEAPSSTPASPASPPAPQPSPPPSPQSSPQPPH